MFLLVKRMAEEKRKGFQWILIIFDIILWLSVCCVFNGDSAASNSTTATTSPTTILLIVITTIVVAVVVSCLKSAFTYCIQQSINWYLLTLRSSLIRQVQPLCSWSLQGISGWEEKKNSTELAVTRAMVILKISCRILWEYTFWSSLSSAERSGKVLNWDQENKGGSD